MRGRISRFFRLTCCEFRKSFVNPIMLIIFVGLLIFNGWKVSSVWDKESDLGNPYFRAVYEEWFAEFGGTIDADKIKKLLSIYQPLKDAVAQDTAGKDYDPEAYTYSKFSDEIFFRTCFLDEIKYDYLYQNYVYELVQQAQDNLNFYQNIGNSYEYKKNQKIIALFAGRKISEFTYTDVYRSFLNYDYSSVLVLLLCIFAMSGVFVIEKESEMDMILTTCKNGGLFTAAAKILSSAVFVCLVSTVFWVEDFIVLAVCAGLPLTSGGPLYGLAAFANTPLSLNLCQSAILFSAVKTLGIFGFCLLFLLISCFVRHNIVSFFLGVCVALALLFLQLKTGTSLLFSYLNPLELLMCRQMFAWSRFVKVFGEPVGWHIFILGRMALEELLLSAAILYFNRRKRKQTISFSTRFGNWNLHSGNYSVFKKKMRENGGEDYVEIGME